MPEGPEIKRVADELAAVLVGEKVVEVTFAFAHLKGYEKELTGRRVRQVRPRGKALLTEFNGGLTIYSHNQLYGRWVIVERGQIPQTDRQLRLALHTKEHACLLYSASDIELLDKEGVACHSFLNRLGPDVLSGSSTRRAIARPKFSRRVGQLSAQRDSLYGPRVSAGAVGFSRQKAARRAGAADAETNSTVVQDRGRDQRPKEL
jgi:endonuclease-8